MSFRLKTIIGVALIEGILLLILVLSSVHYLTQSSEEELALRAQVSAESMANLTRDAVLATDLARLDSVAKRSLASPDIVYVRIMDSEGTLTVAGSPQILARPFTADSRLDAVEDGVFDVGVDMAEGDYAIGRVEIGLSVARASDLIAAARRHLSGIAMVEMLLVALFSYILGAYLTRGLANLGHAAHLITDGGLGAQVDVKGSDELAETGKAFNTMSLRLAESQRVMRQSIAESQSLADLLAEKELRLSTILDTAVDGVVTIDHRGIIDSINGSGARLFGYQAKELLGRNVSCLMPEPHRHGHDGYIQHYLETGEAKVIGRGRQVTGQRKDGSTFPMDLAISEMRLDDRRFFVGLVRDITEQLQVEAAARKSEAMRAAIVDANLDGLVTVDAQDRIIEFSAVAEEIFGHARDAVLGKNMADLIIPSQMRDMHRQGMQRYFATGEGPVLGKRIEVPALRADGGQFPVELTVLPIEVDGETFFTAAVRDISARKAEEQALVDAKQQAEVASAAKSRFLAHMSHEIRSPLNAVLGSLNLLLDAELTKDQRLYAKTAEASGKILLSLINDVLDFSKIEAGHLTLDETDFDIHALVGEAMDMVAFRARDKALPAAAIVDPDVFTWVRGDMPRLRQILNNLLDNALKFTERGGVVLRVEQRRARTDGVDLRFTVEDSGIGIPAESQAALFDEFQQVDSSDSTRFGGTGLGLSICQGLAKLMGGDIGLDSTPGRGSRFWVDVPLQLAAPRRGHDPGPALAFHSALAVGFDPLIADALTRICAGAGCALDTADIFAEDAASAELEVMLVDGRLAGTQLDGLARSARRIGVKRLLLIAAAENPAMLSRVKGGQYDDLVVTPLVIDDLRDSLAPQPPGKTPQSARPNAMRAASPGRSARLLLAEDSVANQVVASAMLHNAGYTVDIANNGREAIDMFGSEAYDAILMDLRMPQVDGLTATAAIRALPGGGEVPIIAMTANAMQQDVERCLAAGMDDFVPKPVDKRRLFETLARLLPSAAAVAEWTEDPQIAVEPAGSGAPLIDEDAVRKLAEDVTPGAVPAMLQMFVTETVQRAENLGLALDRSSLDVLEDEAHTLKSCAGTFGATRLQTLAREIEAACREGNQETAETLSRRMPEVLQQTLAAYRARFAYLSETDE